jgi:DNA-binding MarR family transcriptional regulator/ribosomal protein S18 acetylase RimI-like enzyme
MDVDVVSEMQHLFLGSRLKRLAEQMQTDLLQMTAQAGVPLQPGQYPLLATLDTCGPLTIGELARSMRLSQPAITKHTSRLSKAGLVSISSSDKDGRQRTVALTSAGRAALDQSKSSVWPLVEAAVKELTEDLSGPLLDQIATIEARLATRSLSSRAQTARVALQPALDSDVPAIVSLMNRAYRGVGADAGWNSEAAYLEGERTTEPLLREEMSAKPEASLLVWRTAGEIQGCVWLESQDSHRWYLGSLTVDPQVQAGGLGRKLLAAAEDWVASRGGREIKITVINVREALLDWYARRGYRLTGETEPFPYGDARFGIPKRADLRFVVLQKPLPEHSP